MLNGSCGASSSPFSLLKTKIRISSRKKNVLGNLLGSFLSGNDPFRGRHHALDSRRYWKLGDGIDVSQLSGTLAFDQLFSPCQFLHIRDFSCTCDKILGSPWPRQSVVEFRTLLDSRVKFHFTKEKKICRNVFCKKKLKILRFIFVRFSTASQFDFGQGNIQRVP